MSAPRARAHHKKPARIKPAEENHIEYSVYIHHPANQNNRFWERASVTHDAILALEQAEMLYGSQRYPRVEVKKTFFCKKRKRFVGETLRIFEKPKSWIDWLKNLLF